MQSTNDSYRANAIRVLSRILDPNMAAQVDRYLKSAIVDKCAFVQSAALVCGMQLMNTVPDLVRRWVSEVQSAAQNTSSPMVQYHALALLYDIKSNDRLALQKVLGQFTAEGQAPPKSPMAVCSLIRYTGAALVAHDQDMMVERQLLNFLNTCLRHKSEMVQFEAARAFFELADVEIKRNPRQAASMANQTIICNGVYDMSSAMAVMQVLLNSPKPVVRFAAIRCLNYLAKTRPGVVSRCNSDIEPLLSDSNRNIATLSLTTLLKTGQEANIDKLVKQIQTLMSDISDIYKLDIVRAIKSLCIQYPSKHRVLMGFLSSSLREEGSHEFKKELVDTIILVISQVPAATDLGLLHLCEFIEDCEYPALCCRVLTFLAGHVPSTEHPEKYIRFIYNRLILENAVVRGAAVDALAKIGLAVPSLRADIVTLLETADKDNDDEVRDRIRLYTATLKDAMSPVGSESTEATEDLEVLLTEKELPFSIDALYDSMLAQMSDPNTQDKEVDTSILPTPEAYRAQMREMEVERQQAMEASAAAASQGAIARMGGAKPSTAAAAAGGGASETEASTGSGPRGSGNGAGNGDASYGDAQQEFLNALSPLISSSDLGPLLHSSRGQMLTEQEAEYRVLEFVVTNTLEDVELDNITVKLSGVDESGLFREIGELGIATLTYGDAASAYMVLQKMDGGIHCARFGACLEYTVKEDGDDIGYKDEYPVEDITLTIGDHISPRGLPPGQFRQGWEAMHAQGGGETTAKHILGYKTLEQAIKGLQTSLNCEPCDGSGVISDETAARGHTLLLCGTFAGGMTVLVKCLLGIDPSRGCLLKLSVRAKSQAVTELVARAVEDPGVGASYILSVSAPIIACTLPCGVSNAGSYFPKPQLGLGVRRFHSAPSSSSNSVVDDFVKSLSPNDKHYTGLHPGSIFDRSDTFLPRHIGSGQSDIKEMCRVAGASSLDQLIEETIPSHIMRDPGFLSITTAKSESEALSTFRKMMKRNKLYKNFIGQGYHGTIVPTAILRNLAENPAWYTSYTPYQAEISQGRLEALLIFQTVVSELTGLPVANCSLLDEATAAAEAVTMIQRGVGNSTRKVMFVSDSMHPQTIEVVKTRAKWAGIPLEIGDVDSYDFTRKDLIGAFVQYPDTRGALRDFTFVADALKEGSGGVLAVAADPLALTVCKPPSDMGAQVVVGTMQRFGVPMWYGGPAAGYLATTTPNTRRMAGRLVGISEDGQGNPAYRLTLQTREQHIRLNKATSNVCTAQALLANMSAMYAVYHGPSGLTRIAARVHALGQLFVTGLQQMEVPVVTPSMFFDCVSMEFGSPEEASRAMEAAVAAGMNLRVVDPSTVSATFDETHTVQDVEDLLKVVASATGSQRPAVLEEVEHPSDADLGLIPSSLRRTKPFMSQKIFNTIVTETDLMRYLYHLQSKDISLTKSMITLGSCTMKLNSSSSMYTIVQEEVTTPHPFTPLNQMEGYSELLRSLERNLEEITGFAVCSLQPCSGAQGEFAGLLAIRQYHASRGDTQRSVCLIPRSAHGTNPASAAMMGFEIVWLDDDGPNGMDLDVLDRTCSEIGDRLGALMITYPSTRGVFESHIKAICDTVHKYGGQVYMDGANMNAQLGLTSPGTIGADVCHLNLHKTFSIPHGGGGPGMGPICAAEHLRPFMPSHSVVPTGTDTAVAGSVNAAPFGQAGIASIPWMFINMLGEEGLRASAEMAILNANYMAARLKEYYPLMHVNSNGRCSHEFIIDISGIRKHTGVVEEDIAKRLMDYGFHAPTMSWPVHHSLMIEPTESESKDELDRFCNALIQIKNEIDQIADGIYDLKDNPLKNAPHTEDMVTSEKWDHW
ncbi:hypothetical protein FOZ63_020257 [Perkinsus olseni]|uniref:glycine dehydrogenase (aminomethyl-transferring) n=1 Tax=Perkinsus olseni TaxID=32597 RepID=A0A7J6QAW2_PEROL|nr:hypothetical protein FOZ63_020257 [Perkinsus olseni]